MTKDKALLCGGTGKWHLGDGEIEEKRNGCKSYTNQKQEGDKSSGKTDKKGLHTFPDSNCSRVNVIFDIRDNEIGPP